MSGTLSALGSVTIGEAVPCLGQMVAGINGSIGVQLPSIQGQVTGLLKASASPPTVSVGASASATAVAKLQAQVDGGLPGVNFSVSIITGAVAKLNAQLGALNAQLALAAGFGVAFGAAGVQLYSFGGQLETFGAALAAETAGGFPGGGGASASCNALILVTQVSATWAAMQTVFAAGSPTGLQYLGSKSIGACLPLGLSGSVALAASVNLVLPSLSAQIAAFVQIAPQISLHLPSLTANLEAAIELSASLAIAITPPSFGLQATLLIQLQAQLLSLNAQLAFALGISALLGIGGLSLYVYAGDVGSFGTAVSAGLAENGNGNAIVLATEQPATWSAIEQLLKAA